MTALNLDSIPSGINTYERLFVWVAQALQSTNNGNTLNVVANDSAALTVEVRTAVIADGSDRFIVVGYIPLDRDALNAPSSKTWMAANAISDATPHTNLLSN